MALFSDVGITADIVQRILGYCPPTILGLVRRVSRAWRAFIDENYGTDLCSFQEYAQQATGARFIEKLTFERVKGYSLRHLQCIHLHIVEWRWEFPQLARADVLVLLRQMFQRRVKCLALRGFATLDDELIAAHLEMIRIQQPVGQFPYNRWEIADCPSVTAEGIHSILNVEKGYYERALQDFYRERPYLVDQMREEDRPQWFLCQWHYVRLCLIVTRLNLSVREAERFKELGVDVQT